MADKQDIKDIKFEEAVEKLNAIVSEIERGRTTLESSIERYEEGMKLIRHCRSILQKAEKKIETITGPGDENETSED